MESNYANYSESAAQSPIVGLIYLACLILMIVACWKIFTKAGRPGWASIIPFYNAYVLFDIAWGKGILFLLMFIPIVNIVVSIMLMVKLARAFGKGIGFAIGMILLPMIFYCILGFGDATYIGPQE